MFCISSETHTRCDVIDLIMFMLQSGLQGNQFRRQPCKEIENVGGVHDHFGRTRVAVPVVFARWNSGRKVWFIV